MHAPAVAGESGERPDFQPGEQGLHQEWARRFLLELKSMNSKREEDYMAVGFGLTSFRMVGMGSGFKELDTQECLETYLRSR